MKRSKSAWSLKGCFLQVVLLPYSELGSQYKKKAERASLNWTQWIIDMNDLTENLFFVNRIWWRRVPPKHRGAFFLSARAVVHGLLGTFNSKTGVHNKQLQYSTGTCWWEENRQGFDILCIFLDKGNLKASVEKCCSRIFFPITASSGRESNIGVYTLGGNQSGI